MSLAVPQRGGPGAAPAGGSSTPPSGEGATTRGVSGPTSPVGDNNPSPVSGTQERPIYRDPGADDGRHASPDADDFDALPQDNPIPYSRVRSMREKWERDAHERARKAALQELQGQFVPILQELAQLRQAADPRSVVKQMTEAMLRGAGIEQEEAPPQYVTRAEFEQMQRTERERAQAEWQDREDLQRAEVDLREAKTKHAAIFEAFPQLEEAAAAMWGSPWAVKNKVSLGQIIDKLVTDFNAAVGKVNESYVADKQADLRQQIVAPAGGSATPAPGAKKGEHDLSTDEGTESATRAFLRSRRGQLGGAQS